MQIRAAPSPLRGNSFGQHLEQGQVGFPGEIAVGIGPLDEREQLVFIPALAGRARGCSGGRARSSATSHDLLRQHIKRTFREDQPVQFPGANRPHQYRTFRQVVAGGDEESPLGDRAAPVTGTPNPL